MNRDDFISVDAIRFGLDGLKKNLRFFLILMIIVAVLYNLPTLITTYIFKFQVQDDIPSTRIFLMNLPRIFVTMIIYIAVELGLLKIALNFRDNKPVKFKDLFRGYPLLIKYLGATIIFGLMIMLPLFLLTIAASAFPDKSTSETIIYVMAWLILLLAAAYLYLKYQFYGYFIVDRGSGPIEALQQSAGMTKGVMKNLLIFWLEMNLGIGIALAMVSIFVEIPVALILRLVSEDLAPVAGNLVSSAINLFVIVSLTKLATADIYRRLEWRSAKRTMPGLPGMHPAG